MTMRHPTLDDVRTAIGGDEIVLQTRRRSGHDQFDAVIGADVLLGIIEIVHEHIEQECQT